MSERAPCIVRLRGRDAVTEGKLNRIYRFTHQLSLGLQVEDKCLIVKWVHVNSQWRDGVYALWEMFMCNLKQIRTVRAIRD